MFRADNGYGIALTGYSTAGDGRRWSDISDAEEVRGVDRQIVELEIEKSLRHLNLHPGAAGDHEDNYAQRCLWVEDGINAQAFHDGSSTEEGRPCVPDERTSPPLAPHGNIPLVPRDTFAFYSSFTAQPQPPSSTPPGAVGASPNKNERHAAPASAAASSSSAPPAAAAKIKTASSIVAADDDEDGWKDTYCCWLDDDGGNSFWGQEDSWAVWGASAAKEPAKEGAPPSASASASLETAGASGSSSASSSSGNKNKLDSSVRPGVEANKNEPGAGTRTGTTSSPEEVASTWGAETVDKIIDEIWQEADAITSHEQTDDRHANYFYDAFAGGETDWRGERRARRNFRRRLHQAAGGRNYDDNENEDVEDHESYETALAYGAWSWGAEEAAGTSGASAVCRRGAAAARGQAWGIGELEFCAPAAHQNRPKPRRLLRCPCYQNLPKILIVGDGDLSFSSSMIGHVDDPSTNMVATVLDTEEEVSQRTSSKTTLEDEYLEESLGILRKVGVHVKFGVDATKLGDSFGEMFEFDARVGRHVRVRDVEKFDVIMWNFPCPVRGRSSVSKAGLVRDFFASAAEHLEEDGTGGEIHVTLVNEHFERWGISKIARAQSLYLADAKFFDAHHWRYYGKNHGADFPRPSGQRGAESRTLELLAPDRSRTFVFKRIPLPKTAQPKALGSCETWQNLHLAETATCDYVEINYETNEVAGSEADQRVLRLLKGEKHTRVDHSKLLETHARTCRSRGGLTVGAVKANRKNANVNNSETGPRSSTARGGRGAIVPLPTVAELRSMNATTTSAVGQRQEVVAEEGREVDPAYVARKCRNAQSFLRMKGAFDSSKPPLCVVSSLTQKRLAVQNHRRRAGRGGRGTRGGVKHRRAREQQAAGRRRAGAAIARINRKMLLVAKIRKRVQTTTMVDKEAGAAKATEGAMNAISSCGHDLDPLRSNNNINSSATTSSSSSSNVSCAPTTSTAATLYEFHDRDQMNASTLYESPSLVASDAVEDADLFHQEEEQEDVEDRGAFVRLEEEGAQEVQEHCDSSLDVARAGERSCFGGPEDEFHLGEESDSSEEVGSCDDEQQQQQPMGYRAAARKANPKRTLAEVNAARERGVDGAAARLKKRRKPIIPLATASRPLEGTSASAAVVTVGSNPFAMDPSLQHPARGDHARELREDSKEEADPEVEAQPRQDEHQHHLLLTSEERSPSRGTTSSSNPFSKEATECNTEEQSRNPNLFHSSSSSVSSAAGRSAAAQVASLKPLPAPQLIRPPPTLRAGGAAILEKALAARSGAASSGTVRDQLPSKDGDLKSGDLIGPPPTLRAGGAAILEKAMAARSKAGSGSLREQPLGGRDDSAKMKDVLVDGNPDPETGVSSRSAQENHIGGKMPNVPARTLKQTFSKSLKANATLAEKNPFR